MQVRLVQDSHLVMLGVTIIIQYYYDVIHGIGCRNGMQWSGHLWQKERANMTVWCGLFWVSKLFGEGVRL